MLAATVGLIARAIGQPCRKSLLRYRHDVGALESQQEYYRRLFNIGALAGAAIHNHGHDLKVLHSEGTYGVVYSMESPNCEDLCSFVHFTTPPAKHTRIDAHKLAFVKTVMYNIEHTYAATSQIELDLPAVRMINTYGEPRLLTLDAETSSLTGVIKYLARLTTNNKLITGIDIYDSWRNEIVHLDIANTHELAKECH
ncbi:hypothetical protein D5b_00020 [Faustovirus]|nr:hypothetical protein D5b_00020 [Faustovirus]AMN84889.1 hypothetical protein D6_00490 [Faustovirus]AMP43980.1 hypothetical protein PRJ_Dakar_00020 [Faustovirus]